MPTSFSKLPTSIDEPIAKNDKWDDIIDILSIIECPITIGGIAERVAEKQKINKQHVLVALAVLVSRGVVDIRPTAGRPDCVMLAEPVRALIAAKSPEDEARSARRRAPKTPRSHGKKTVKQMVTGAIIAELQSGPKTQAGIAEATGINRRKISLYAIQLINDGIVEKIGRTIIANNQSSVTLRLVERD